MAEYHQKYIIPTIVFAVAVFYPVKLSSAGSSVKNDQQLKAKCILRLYQGIILFQMNSSMDFLFDLDEVF